MVHYLPNWKIVWTKYHSEKNKQKKKNNLLYNLLFIKSKKIWPGGFCFLDLFLEYVSEIYFIFHIVFELCSLCFYLSSTPLTHLLPHPLSPEPHLSPGVGHFSLIRLPSYIVLLVPHTYIFAFWDIFGCSYEFCCLAVSIWVFFFLVWVKKKKTEFILPSSP